MTSVNQQLVQGFQLLRLLVGLHKLSLKLIHNWHPNELHRQMRPKRIDTVILSPKTFRLEVPWTIGLRPSTFQNLAKVLKSNTLFLT
jgi:hypothetical protein